jgi:hypothetical protein
MDFLGIFLLIYLGYSNSVRAKLKGQNGILWAFLTIISYIVFEGIGLFVVISFFCKDAIDMNMLAHATKENMDAVSRQFNVQVMRALAENPLRQATVLAFGFGGYLLIRFILEQKPDKKQPEIPQADQLGD